MRPAPRASAGSLSPISSGWSPRLHDGRRHRHACPRGEAPALDAAVVENGARVIPPGRHGHRRPPRAEVDEGQGVAHLAGRGAARPRVAEPELTVRVLPPALDPVIVEQRARVKHPRRDRRAHEAATRSTGAGAASTPASIGGRVAAVSARRSALVSFPPSARSSAASTPERARNVRRSRAAPERHRRRIRRGRPRSSRRRCAGRRPSSRSRRTPAAGGSATGTRCASAAVRVSSSWTMNFTAVRRPGSRRLFAEGDPFSYARSSVSTPCDG